MIIYKSKEIPKIIEVYGKDAIDISDDTILVTIPFNRIK